MELTIIQEPIIRSKNYNILAIVEVSKRIALTNKRRWDKTESCIFCEEQITNFTRNLMIKHGEEIEVGKLLSLKKGSKERKCLIDQLCKRGNFFNNIKNTIKIKPVRRPNEIID